MHKNAQPPVSDAHFRARCGSPRILALRISKTPSALRIGSRRVRMPHSGCAGKSALSSRSSRILIASRSKFKLKPFGTCRFRRDAALR